MSGTAPPPLRCPTGVSGRSSPLEARDLIRAASAACRITQIPLGRVPRAPGPIFLSPARRARARLLPTLAPRRASRYRMHPARSGL